MSGEMIAIVAVGVALAGVILTSLKGTETWLREDISQLRGDMKQLSERVARVEHSASDSSKGCWKGCARPSSGRVKAS